MVERASHGMDVVTETVSSTRLDLVPFSAEFLRASLAGNLAEAEEHLGAKLPEGWPNHPGIYGRRLAQLEAEMDGYKTDIQKREDELIAAQAAALGEKQRWQQERAALRAERERLPGCATE